MANLSRTFAVRVLAALLVFGAAGLSAARADAPVTDRFPQLGVVPKGGGFRMDGYWVWCGAVIKAEDGCYHMFASRWPRDITFHPGWMTNSEIVRAVADKPEGPYTFQEVVLPARSPEYWDGRATHNPSITKHGDTYVLFYMGSTNPIGTAPRGTKFELTDPMCTIARANKRIGVATARASPGRGRATTARCSTRSRARSTASSRPTPRRSCTRTARSC